MRRSASARRSKNPNPRMVPLYRIKLTLDTPNLAGQIRWVCDPDRQWDASWYTRRLHEAKAWKTRRGAENWLIERPAIKGEIMLGVLP